jgi:hypothetical protein
MFICAKYKCELYSFLLLHYYYILYSYYYLNNMLILIESKTYAISSLVQTSNIRNLRMC